MRTVDDIVQDIFNIKKERKEVKKEFGKRSVKYAELTEELDNLKDELEFILTYAEE